LRFFGKLCKARRRRAGMSQAERSEIPVSEG